MPCLSVTMALACVEGARYMSDIDVKAYIGQLRQALPYVPPIPVQEIKAMHRKRDLGGIVKLIRNTMSVNVRLTLHWTDQVRGDAPAWVLLPEKMPYYGTPEFAKIRIVMFIRRSFAEARPYNEFAMAVAHEFSHIVLDSIHHSLRSEEKAVDLTAMILGFSYLYRRGAHTVERAGLNRYANRRLGYLSKRELDTACRILVPAKMRARHTTLAFLDASAGLLALGAFCFSVWAFQTIRK
jgi:hypothetical protein